MEVSNSVGSPPKFGKTPSGTRIQTRATRIPSALSRSFMSDLVKHCRPLLDSQDLVEFRDVVMHCLKSVKTEPPKNTIAITTDDLANINNRALGFIAYKFQLRPTQSEIRKDDRDSILEQIEKLIS